MSLLESELEFSLQTRGIKICFDGKDDCIKNVEDVAKLRSWKPKTLRDFTKYLDELFKRIEDERVANAMECKLNNLVSLNYYLSKFGKAPRSSLTKARKLLKTEVFIGIYDLEAERFDLKHNTYQELHKYLKADKKRIFPREIAKRSKILKQFLQFIF